MTSKAHKIELTIEQQRLMERHLETGNYSSPDEVIDEAFAALDARQTELDEVLRNRVNTALASNEPGVSIDEAFARARAAIKAAAKAKSRDA